MAIRRTSLLEENVPSDGLAAQNEGSILGASEAIHVIRRQVAAIADTTSTVLILGESGVGKEVVAQEIHRLSSRRQRPWVIINCAAIPENLLESEFFGHRRGAFTDAHENKIGLFQKAHEGTILLDEIGDLPLALQSKLLRVLDSGEVRPVGETERTHVDVRVIAATNRDLHAAITARTFREDLYYRLSVVSIEIPPLRERPKDIPVLAQHFLKHCSQRLNARTRGISPGGMGMLKAQSWKGNARELENAIEQAVTLQRHSDFLTEKDFPLYLERRQDERMRRFLQNALESRLSIDEYARRFITHFEDTCTERELARLLGLSPKTLWEKRKRFKLPRKKAQRKRARSA